MDDRNVLAAALTLGAAMELDHRRPRAAVPPVQQAVNLETIEACVRGLDGLDELHELSVVADMGPAAVRRPLVDLGRMCRLLPACEYRAIVVTPAEVVARRPGDVRQNEATLPVEVVSRLATRQFDDSKVVANTLIHDHKCPPAGMIDGVALDVVLFVNEPAFDHLRSFRIDFGQPHEVAAAGVRQHEHPARRPPDLADSAGIG